MNTFTDTAGRRWRLSVDREVLVRLEIISVNLNDAIRLTMADPSWAETWMKIIWATCIDQILKEGFSSKDFIDHLDSPAVRVAQNAITTALAEMFPQQYATD